MNRGCVKRAARQNAGKEIYCEQGYKNESGGVFAVFTAFSIAAFAAESSGRNRRIYLEAGL
ncbi:MAG: hypothetical protein LBC53_06530 [Spirochaetaceae bacterium]|jgi:hypothetical protein|nr:hypothetical protein [Spirochaetaceae bacterium]